MNLTRRTFLATAAAAPLLAADDGWVPLFDGHTLDGWQPSEHKDSWKIVGAQIAADGARSHLFYNGPVHGANFKNFELEVDALARPGCNSGVYFHTAYQETGFPIKGFEVQINHTFLGEGNYRERKKTGSLYGLRNVYMQLIPDDQWFKIRVAVRGKNVQIRLNDTLVVDYTEPTPPVIPAGAEKERYLDRGTFALQCHNDGSKAFFRSVRVRPLPDDAPTPGGPAPVVDETFRRIIDVGRSNYPMVDYHVHLKGGLTLERALTKDPELFIYGWDRHVVLVSPSTLLMTMRTVASIWRYEQQGQNAQEIARLAGDLCDKISMSLGDLNVVAEKMNGALAAHNEAVKRLSTGRGNALSVGERIRSLGVKTKRPLPAMLVDGMAITSEAEEFEASGIAAAAE